MSSLIFLDFDGVLHPQNYLRFAEINGELTLLRDERFCWAPDFLDLIHGFNCALVIHSSWRTLHTLAQIKGMLPPALAARVQATTGPGERYDSIVSYVEKHQVADFLILDDAADEFPPGLSNLVICDGRAGVTDLRVRQRVAHFLRQTSP